MTTKTDPETPPIVTDVRHPGSACRTCGHRGKYVGAVDPSNALPGWFHGLVKCENGHAWWEARIA